MKIRDFNFLRGLKSFFASFLMITFIVYEFISNPAIVYSYQLQWSQTGSYGASTGITSILGPQNFIYVFVNGGTKLLLFKFDPNNFVNRPVKIWEDILPDITFRMKIINNRLYVNTFQAGLIIYDLTDIEHPVFKQWYSDSTIQYFGDIVYDETRGYIYINCSKGLLVFEETQDGVNLVRLVNYNFGFKILPGSLIAKDNNLFFSMARLNNQGDLYYIDLSGNVENWTIEQVYSSCGYLTKLTINNNYLWASKFGGSSNSEIKDADLLVFNITTPQSPEVVGTFFEDYPQSNSGLSYSHFVKDNLLYLCCNLSWPEFDNSTPYPCILDYHPTIYILDMNSPGQNMQPLATLYTVDWPYDLSITGDFLFVADEWAGLLIFKLQNNGLPENFGPFRYSLGGVTNSAIMNDKYILLSLRGGGIQIFQKNLDNNLNLILDFKDYFIYNIREKNDKFYVAGAWGRDLKGNYASFLIFENKEGGYTKTYEFPFGDFDKRPSVMDIIISGDLAFVASGIFGVNTFCIKDGEINNVQSLILPDFNNQTPSAVDIERNGSYLYVIGAVPKNFSYESNLYILQWRDTSQNDPVTCEQARNYELQLATDPIYINKGLRLSFDHNNNELAIANKTYVTIYNCDSPTNPSEIYTITLENSSDIKGVFHSGNKTYIADINMGIYVYENQNLLDHYPTVHSAQLPTDLPLLNLPVSVFADSSGKVIVGDRNVGYVIFDEIETKASNNKNNLNFKRKNGYDNIIQINSKYSCSKISSKTYKVAKKIRFFKRKGEKNIKILVIRFGSNPEFERLDNILIESGYSVDSLIEPQPGDIAQALHSTSYQQIWLYDNTNQILLTSDDDLQALLNFHQMKPALVIDGRAYGIAFATVEREVEDQLVQNIAYAFENLGGGMWLGADHSPDWSKNVNALLTYFRYGLLIGEHNTAITDGNDNIELLNNPNTICPTQLWYASVSSVPVGLQPDGILLEPVIWSNAFVYISACLLPAIPTTSTPTPIYTSTPTQPPFTPTVTPNITPTPICNLGVSLLMPKSFFTQGDTCWLKAFICNPYNEPLNNINLFVILDIGIGEYWFYPSWCHYPDDIDYEPIPTLSPGVTEKYIIEPFYFPPNAGQGSNFNFIGAITDENISTILGNILQMKI